MDATTDGLQRALNHAFWHLEISDDQTISLMTYLQVLKSRDEDTWMHSVRVGLKGIEIAEFANIIDPKGLFYPALVHDVGKSLSDPQSLKKKVGFDSKDKQELKRHPLDGYRLLRGIHDFSARVLLFHHYFIGESYPKKIPKSEIQFSRGSQTIIMYYARLLGVIDFYDALTHRENDRFSPGNPRLPTKDEAKEILIKQNPDQAYLINQLYKNEIF